jgi:hypothetical protein
MHLRETIGISHKSLEVFQKEAFSNLKVFVLRGVAP